MAKFGFIGCGNMGGALARAMRKNIDGSNIVLTNRSLEKAEKLAQELGWKPAETFESGIRKTVQWYIDNPQWVADVTSGAYRDWVARQYVS